MKRVFTAQVVAALTVGILGACSTVAPTTTPSAAPPASVGPSASPSASPTPPGSPTPVDFSDICRTTGSFVAATVVGGITRYVLVHRPASAPSRAPLVIALHGNGGSPDAMVGQTGLSAAADEHGFTVVYPAGESQTWGIQVAAPRFQRDAELLSDLRDELLHGDCVDLGRVVLAGFSLGGFLADAIACADAVRFHTVVAVAARDVSEPCAPVGPVAFVAYNAVTDAIVPYKGGDIGGWHLPSADAWAAAWAVRNGCSEGPVTASTNDRVDRFDWTTGCRAPVVLYRIKKGSHTWPGGDPPIGGLSAADTGPTETILRLVAGLAP